MKINKILLLLVSIAVIVSAETLVYRPQRRGDANAPQQPLIVQHSSAALPQQLVESPEE